MDKSFFKCPTSLISEIWETKLKWNTTLGLVYCQLRFAPMGSTIIDGLDPLELILEELIYLQAAQAQITFKYNNNNRNELFFSILFLSYWSTIDTLLLFYCFIILQAYIYYQCTG